MVVGLILFFFQLPFVSHFLQCNFLIVCVATQSDCFATRATFLSRAAGQGHCARNVIARSDKQSSRTLYDVASGHPGNSFQKTFAIQQRPSESFRRISLMRYIQRAPVPQRTKRHERCKFLATCGPTPPFLCKAKNRKPKIN